MRFEETGVFRAVRPIVLASASPRRRELLAGMGIAFSLQLVPNSEPAFHMDDDPAEYVMRAARCKALAAAERIPSPTPVSSVESLPVVLGADTIVVLHESGGPVLLGKPASSDEALAMLLTLSGREHCVYTGCCLVWSESPAPRVECFYDVARVTFGAWPEDVLRAYVATGECSDKAGSYAIQGKGAFLVSRIDGLWSTIVGLPVSLLAERLLKGAAIRCGVVSMKEA